MGQVKKTHEGWDGREVEETCCFRKTEGDKMVQGSEALAVKNDNLSWILESHMAGGSRLRQIVL